MLPVSHLRVAMVLGVIALGLGFVPPGQVSGVRAHLLDVLKPGLDCWHIAEKHGRQATANWSIRWPEFTTETHQEDITRLTDEVNTWQQKYRQLQIENAKLHQQWKLLAQTGASPYPSRPGRNLVKAEVLEAVVLNEKSEDIWQPGRIINRGSTDGLTASDLVLDGDAPLIDQGKNSRLTTGQPVYAGRCVVGRLENVGRVTSTVQTVTDSEYRGFAQLVRKTKDGFLFGAEGVIEGDGKSCRLRYIAGTEPVEVGDDVYTGDHDGSQPHPMYYGKVVRAVLNPGDQEWQIEVEPAVTSLETPTVTVLRTRIDIARALAN